MHDCPCPEHQGLTHAEKRQLLKDRPCPMNGRRLIELANGKCEELFLELKRLIPQKHSKAAAALRELEKLDKPAAQCVVNSFAAAKAAMLVRFEQGTSFYSQFPWNIPKLLTYILVPRDLREQSVQASRDFARELLGLHRAGKLDRKTFADFLFEGSFLDSLTEWASGNVEFMENELFRELLYYGLSLVAMQRLESRHHLVHQRAVPARAGTSAYHSANLRRKLNDDCRQASFRAGFSAYLGRFDELVPEPWSSKCELAKLVAGHHLSIMFKDTSVEDALLNAAAPAPKTRIENALVFQDHLKKSLSPGSHYAVPISVSPEGDTTYCIIQIVDPRPAGKRYMQRTVGWSDDIWHDHVGVLLMGTHVVCTDTGVVNLDCEPDSPLPLQTDFQFVASVGDVEAFPLCAFFKYNFDNIFEMTKVEHTCDLSMDAITAVMSEESTQELLDMTVLQLNSTWYWFVL